MIKATKVRLYPTPEQQQALAVQFGCARYVYNRALEIKSTAWKQSQESISCFTIKSMLRQWKSEPETAWLKDADSQVLQESVRNLDKAYKNFFEKRARYPKFKKKYGRQSIAYPQRVTIDGDCIKLPKVGMVLAVLHREIDGRIATVTISRETTGKYFASILHHTEEETPKPLTAINGDKVIGLDMGLTHFVITSDGKKADNPRFLKNAYRNLRRRSKSLSRAQKGSKNRSKKRLLLAKAHERVAFARADFQHKVSRNLVDNNHAISVETLAVKNMLKNRKLSKAISDASWSSLIAKIAYKAKNQGKHLIRIDRWTPSSKACSCCGAVVEHMPLSVRFWQCAHCGTEHDRDINAAINIRNMICTGKRCQRPRPSGRGVVTR